MFEVLFIYQIFNIYNLKNTLFLFFTLICNANIYFKFLFDFYLNYRKADIALIGLAVMGQNLILNMDSKGFVVCAYNRTVDKVSGNY